MKNLARQFTGICLIAGLLILFGCERYPKTVESPQHGLSNSETLNVNKIVLTDTATVFYIDSYYPTGQWIRIDSGTYLQTREAKYMITGSENIELNEQFFMSESGEHSFILFFPPLPKGTKSVDFIESDCDNCFKIWDIDLTGKGLKYTPEIPKEALNIPVDKKAALPPVELNAGKTIVNLHLFGLKEGYVVREPELLIYDIFISNYKQVEPTTKEGDIYTFEFNQFGTTTALLTIGFPTKIILSPGETVDVYVDLKAKSMREAKNKPQENMVYIGFSGKYAALNKELVNLDPDVYKPDPEERPDILSLSPQEWAQSEMAILKQTIAKMDEDNSLSQAIKDYQKLCLEVNLINMFSHYENSYKWAYAEKNNLNWREHRNTIKAPEGSDKIYSLLEDINLNNTDFLYSINSFMAYSSSAWSFSKEEINKITGSETGIIQDFQKIAPIASKAESSEGLTPEEEATYNSLSIPLFKEAFEITREEAKRKYEEAMAKGGYTLLETPSASNEKLFEAMLAQHKGKPLFIDFWATWCGPCLQGIKLLKPFKPEIKQEGIEIIYISGETSPKMKWLNMLPDMGETHYYLSKEQWDAVCKKLGIRGIPTYIIADKNGKIVFQQSGFPGVDKLREAMKLAL